ncbi:MAG: hypothetical protein F4X99_09705 [Gammaproteobacteria bacterium]|nr:hypothetical protein [Gammaproteobacteria bacterium]
MDGIAKDRRLPWLLSAKVAVPSRVPHYFERTQLLARALPTQRRLSVLRAPGGFGKTTVLAESCRRLVADGVPTAWISLDEQDDGRMLDAYLAFAFERAGLGLLETLGTGVGFGSAFGPRTELVMRAVEAHGGPCVLALDQVERVAETDALELIDFLFRLSPPNLHLAVACRALPPGLDIAGIVVAGSGEVLAADDLRFSKGEVDAFLADPPQRRRSSLGVEAAGWPIALRFHRDGIGVYGDEDAVSTDGSADRVVDNWVESRLWRGVSLADRQLLLDAGLFEWLDADLFDEVIGEGGAMQRLANMPVLEGLLERAPDVRSGWRLHPLLRGHCARRVSQLEPQRFRDMHGRIAEALARRGETTLAVRHAGEAGDAALAGRILEDAGGIRLYLREGLVRLRAADRVLSEDAAARPRLALAHCALLAADGRLDEAREAYARVDAVVDRAPASDLDLHADRCLVAGVLAMYDCVRLDSAEARELIEIERRLAASEELDPGMRAAFHHGLCITHSLRAEFEAASGRAAAARRFLGRETTSLSMFVDMELGAMAMAQGRVSEAARWYGNVQRTAKAAYLRDPAAAAMAGVLFRELAHERNRLARVPEAESVPRVLARGGAPFAPYAAAAGTAVESTLRHDGAAVALTTLEEMFEYATRHELPALRRFLAALHVSLLAESGAVGAAERIWRDVGLPEEASGCLDLSGQSWREMEAIACARLRLHIAREEYAPGRAFGHTFTRVARRRGLRRTLMRGLALSTTLEHRRGTARVATARMKAFLAEYAQADYAGPMVRERAAGLPVLTRVLEGVGDSGERSAALTLSRDLKASEKQGVAPRLTARQREVVRHLALERDKEIARALGITEAGVRYHVGRVFDALGVRGRSAAVERARELGLLGPDADEDPAT